MCVVTSAAHAKDSSLKMVNS